jgi:hypothetical protein
MTETNNFLKSLEIILGLCREPIPSRFYRTFEDELFDTCSFCHAPLLAENRTYTIAKFYSDDELQEEIVICRACSSELKQGYSGKSQQVLKQLYNAEYEKRRLGVLLRAGECENKVALMTSSCALCSGSKSEHPEYFEYALCKGDEIIFYTHPSMICLKCAIQVHENLSPATKDHKHRFFEEHFGFPPSDSLINQPVKAIFGF